MRLRLLRFAMRALLCLVLTLLVSHLLQPSWWDGAFVAATRHTAYAQEQGDGGCVSDFEIEPLYKAAKLTWRARVSGDGSVNFEIYRSVADPAGPYTLVTTIEARPGKKKYGYIDKQLPVEENYYYKIEVPATDESFGPVQVRPPFSLPST